MGRYYITTHYFSKLSCSLRDLWLGWQVVNTIHWSVLLFLKWSIKLTATKLKPRQSTLNVNKNPALIENNTFSLKLPRDWWEIKVSPTDCSFIRIVFHSDTLMTVAFVKMKRVNTLSRRILVWVKKLRAVFSFN